MDEINWCETNSQSLVKASLMLTESIHGQN